MTLKACRNCHYISSGPRCPNCKSTNLTTSYSGIVIVIDVDKSIIAKILKIKSPGPYALKVR